MYCLICYMFFICYNFSISCTTAIDLQVIDSMLLSVYPIVVARCILFHTHFVKEKKGQLVINIYLRLKKMFTK